MRRRTLRRARQERQYSIERPAFIEEQRSRDKRGNIYCIFCGQVVASVEPDCHHGDGRDDEKLLDKTKWFLAHRQCHSDFHSKSWTKLKWWNIYLEQLKIMGKEKTLRQAYKRMEK
jgi:hypothetical protein